MSKIIFLMSFLLIFSLPCSSEIIQDSFVDNVLRNQTFENPNTHLKYNYQDTDKIPVRMTITKDITSENDLYEGEEVNFRVAADVIYNGKIVIAKGTIVPAKVETIISSGMNGIPASIIFGDFKFPNIDENKTDYTYERFGQDRSLWVFPLKWSLTFLPPTGSLTNFIKGGHARLKTNKIIEIYYHPNWI